MIELTPTDREEIARQLANRPGRRTQSAEATQFETEPKRIIAVVSGKGGVGKSTIAVNLAASAAVAGLRVGLLDADLHGFSVPRMLGVDGAPVREETKAGNRLHPPSAHGVSVMSIGMFTDPNSAVVWRGPVAHRALTQFLEETVWGALDLLVVDLPPGTGDVALSVANLLPQAELLVATTPQAGVAEVAGRAGAMALHTRQRVIGVVENMEMVGGGGGELVAAQLTGLLGYPVPVLARIPFDPLAFPAGDSGVPLVIGEPDSPAAAALRELAGALVA